MSLWIWIIKVRVRKTLTLGLGLGLGLGLAIQNLEIVQNYGIEDGIEILGIPKLRVLQNDVEELNY